MKFYTREYDIFLADLSRHIELALRTCPNRFDIVFIFEVTAVAAATTAATSQEGQKNTEWTLQLVRGSPGLLAMYALHVAGR